MDVGVPQKQPKIIQKYLVYQMLAEMMKNTVAIVVKINLQLFCHFFQVLFAHVGADAETR